MNYARMVIEKEAPEEYGYDRITYHLPDSSLADQTLSDIRVVSPVTSVRVLCFRPLQ